MCVNLMQLRLILKSNKITGVFNVLLTLYVRGHKYY